MSQILLFLLLSLLNSGTSQPFCKCEGLEKKAGVQYLVQSLEKAQVVLYAKVAKLNDREMAQKSGVQFQSPEPLGYFPRLTAVEILKGGEFLKGAEIQLYQELDDCAMGFKEGQNYLVYGILDENGKLYTNACWPTREIAGNVEWQRIRTSLMN